MVSKMGQTPRRGRYVRVARSPGVTPGYADLESALILPINPPQNQ
jgi:hypothetical protein